MATAATLAVVYPHMTGLGGDGFWLISVPDQEPIAIDACGVAATSADLAFYRGQHLKEIPWRGPLAANTVAGTVAGWRAALELSARWSPRMPLACLLEDAVSYAENGIVVTASQAELTRLRLGDLRDVPGFAENYLGAGQAPRQGEILKQQALGSTLRKLAQAGLDDFYRGQLAFSMAADLRRAGSPLAVEDLRGYHATITKPLSVRIKGATLFNFPPPTQGLASLMILAMFERLGVREAETFEHVHSMVEATKQAFLIRDREIGDPSQMTREPAAFLSPALLDSLAERIDGSKAMPWPAHPSGGDTVWLGVADNKGRMVSFIQSLYFEFGSGVVLPETGIVWQNRGSAFRCVEDGPNALKPGYKPFHTLNPAMTHFDDGRRMAYGTMGGDGQPQFQSAIFSRYAFFGQGLQEAITRPRWLLGRLWGEESTTLKLEIRFESEMVDALKTAGHDVELLEPFSSKVGHAGAIVVSGEGLLEGAADPRSDGAVAAW